MKSKLNEQKLSEIRPEFLDMRWTPLPDARTARGRRWKCRQGVRIAVSKDPRGPPRLSTNVIFFCREKKEEINTRSVQ